MSCFLFPDILYESTYDVDYQALYDRGIRTLLFDIDNTLVGHGEPMDNRAKNLINRLKAMGFYVLAVSNNKEPRVKSFCQPADISYIYKAGKPLRSGYERAMKKAGGTPKTTAFIGDQIFTDIVGAKILGIYSVLVRPLYPKEEIQIVLKRFLEAPVLALYKALHVKNSKQQK